jgi:hypothetical protein
MFVKRITVPQHHRTLVVKNNRIMKILRPGVHRVFVRPFTPFETEVHSLYSPVVRSKWLGTLLKRHSDLTLEHFVVVRTDSSHLAMISVDGALYQVLLPGRRLVLWREAAQITVETVNILETPVISDTMLDEFEHQKSARFWRTSSDDSGSAPLIDAVLDYESTSRQT